ncbi:MAG: DegT/DnrJ/EryC1/StrS family aminotransferase [Candidatus Tectimicrobiota bacterium]
MIPRVRPSYSWADLLAALRAPRNSVEQFENALATRFGRRYAIAFPYGRSAIYACLRACRLVGSEVVQPAYNCVVVAHATVLAGYRPVFVDTQTADPNQDPEAMLERVGARTAAVIPTSLFGMSFDAAALCRAIRRRNPQALILLDCCQAFDAQWQGEPLLAQGDAALLAFGIGKPMTALYGGALLTDRDDIGCAVRHYRNTCFRQPTRWAVLQRWGYFLASWLALSGPLVALTDRLEHTATPLRRYLLTLRAREAIRLPADSEVQMTAVAAAIGLSQLPRSGYFTQRRQALARIYSQALGDVPDLHVLPWTDGSSYAIYAIRLGKPDSRPKVLAALRRGGVQGDTVLNYVVPGLACYGAQGYDNASFPHALAWAESVLNLPNYPSLSDTQALQCAQLVRQCLAHGV